MHSGRTGSEATHPTQQQRVSPLAAGNNTAVLVPSATSSHQPSMLSAGQPALSSGLFRTGTDIPSPSHRLVGSGGSSYLPTQYSTIYGVHNQTASHIRPSIQPYNAAFLPPQFAAGTGGSTTHGFSHSPLLATSTTSHYHQFESYSAMLASMGSHVQQRATQASDAVRSSRNGQGSVNQSHLTSSSFTSVSTVDAPTTHQSLSSSTSTSSNTTVVTSISVPGLSSRLDSTSSLQKSVTHELRNDHDSSRKPRVYDSSSNLENKHSQPMPGSYSVSDHVQKVSFDTVVKEFGGRNSPSGPDYFRSHLSGKEGSLKHRILIRPSDADEDPEKADDLKEEPILKRFKLSQSGVSNCQIEEILKPNNQYSIGYTDHSFDSSGSVEEAAHNKIRSAFNSDKTNQSFDFQQSKTSAPSVPLSPHYYNAVDSQDVNKDCDTTSYPTSDKVDFTGTSTNPSAGGSHLQYPMYFMKGSIIQLADGTLKRVEELQTEDFISSAEISADLKVDSSTVERIEEHIDKGTAMLSFSVGEHKVQVTVEATLEHPFFVFQRGWSSCSVSRTLARYGLDCQKLCVGDVCISLTQKDVDLKAAESSQQPFEQTTTPSPALQSAATYVKNDRINATPLVVSTASTSLSSPSMRRRTPPTELPPPLTNIVPVKKESNNLQFVRGPHNGEDQGKELGCEKIEDDDLKSMHQKRHWSGQDNTSYKTGSDIDQKFSVKEGSKSDEAVQDSS